MLHKLCLIIVWVVSLSNAHFCIKNSDCENNQKCRQGLCQQNCPVSFLSQPPLGCEYRETILQNGCPMPKLFCFNYRTGEICPIPKILPLPRGCEYRNGSDSTGCPKPRYFCSGIERFNCEKENELCPGGTERCRNGLCLKPSIACPMVILEEPPEGCEYRNVFDRETGCDMPQLFCSNIPLIDRNCANVQCPRSQRCRDGMCVIVEPIRRDSSLPQLIFGRSCANVQCPRSQRCRDGMCVIVEPENDKDECDVNEEFRECGSACEPSCSVPKPRICTMQCIINICQCKRGYFRNPRGDCVPKSWCRS